MCCRMFSAKSKMKGVYHIINFKEFTQELQGASPSLPPPGLCPGSAERLKTPPPDPQLQGGHSTLCFQHNIHTSCNLQTTDSGKNISILMRKLREKGVEIIKNSGKMMLKILYEPCITICFKL